MENTNGYPQQTYPGFRSFPPPTAWIDPDSVSSDDGNTPTWVIVGVVIVVVILGGALFYYIRRREKKIRKKAAAAAAKLKASKQVTTPPATNPKPDSGPPAKKDPPASKDKPADKPKKDPTPVGIPISYPGDCPACGQRGGLYTFSYTCPQCKYKMEYNVAYPPKK